MGQAPLLLEPGAALVVERALVRKQAFLPARQKYGVEFEPLGGMQRHDRHRLALALLGVHHQRNVLEEAGKILELLHGADELFQVLEPPGGIGGAVALPHLGVAGFVEHDLREPHVRKLVLLRAPALERGEQVAQRRARLGLELVGLDHRPRGRGERHAAAARVVVQELHGGVAEPALGHVDDALEGEIVRHRMDHAQISQRVADFLALVEARATDHAIRQAERDEAVLELTHLERGAHQDRDLVERVRRAVPVVALQLLDLLADGARFFLGIPARGDLDLLARLVLGAQRLAEPALVVGDEMRGGGEDVAGRAIIALEANDIGAGEIVLEAQDIVDFGAAPAVDRLVVVTDAADVFEHSSCRRRGVLPLPACGQRIGGALGAWRIPLTRRAARRALPQQAQPEILRHIGVLVLVDQHVAEARLILAQHLGLRRGRWRSSRPLRRGPAQA